MKKPGETRAIYIAFGKTGLGTSPHLFAFGKNGFGTSLRLIFNHSIVSGSYPLTSLRSLPLSYAYR